MYFSLIVLNYNGEKYLHGCLASLLQVTSSRTFEILCVDNGSQDGSFERAQHAFAGSRIRFIQNGGNYGYAEGNDRAAAHANGEILVFLNNDLTVEPSFLDDLEAVFENASVGVAQSRLVKPDPGLEIESRGHRIDVLGIAQVDGGEPSDEVPRESGKRIFGATGAAIAVRRSLFEALHGFDESYFLMFEETDLCWRAWLRGYDVVLADGSLVFHAGRGSIGMNPMALRMMVRNRLTSILKNAGPPLLIIMLPGNLAAMSALAAFNLISGKPQFAHAIATGVAQFFGRFFSTLGKRVREQRLRRRSDAFLLRNGLISWPSLAASKKNLRAFS